MFIHILEVLTIGLPFCTFKIISGLHLNQTWLILLGIADLIINLVNLISLVILKRRIFDSCSLSFLVITFKKPSRELRFKWQDLGSALDVFLSFVLVASMIGLGFLGQLSLQEISFWNLSVILNVIGAGIGRLSGSIQNLKQ